MSLRAIAPYGVTLLCALGVFARAAPEPAPAPRAVVGREWNDPPPEVAALLKQVGQGTPTERDDDAKALARMPEAEPYLRFALLFDPDKRLRAAHAEQLTAVGERNVKRAKKWAADGRLDLLVEAICATSSNADADAMTEHLFVFARDSSFTAGKLLTGKEDGFPRLGPPGGFTNFAKFNAIRYAGEKVHLDKTQAGRMSLIRAERLSSEDGLTGTVAVVRDKWTGLGKVTKLFDVMLFVNGDVALGDLDRCLVVTDGDVTRWELGKDAGAGVSSSIVIAHGSIGGPARIGAGSVKSCVWAGGDVTIRKTDSLADWAILARGEVQVETTPGREPTLVKSKTNENPFGVRFFETTELGVEVEDHAGGVRIKSLAVDSPLAAGGLRVGDVVVRVNDTRTESAKEFRRELRRSLIWEAGVFWLNGDGKRMTRVVRLADALK